ncbi:hypothetical protein [Cupriavidus basilensis]|uniref:hypothetical protein n=1 Tax=Cupriavidus basilensis TaxID=68895 RepID=UPI0023E81671|nr:hypothetical protein [Cupriavidus basilensis]MDF3884563.1 hypothetical protein [Cupriavidus basilensis]
MSISHTARLPAVARFVFAVMSAALAFGTQAQSSPKTSPTLPQAATLLPEAATKPVEMAPAQAVAPTQQPQAVTTLPEIATPAMAMPQAADPPASITQAQAAKPEPLLVIVQPEAAASQAQRAVMRPQASGAQLMAPRTVGNVTYICGGTGVEEQDYLSNLEQQYNLGVIFTEGPRGDLLAGVDVRLRRHGRVLAAFQATGPRCLFKVPPADYRVEATYKQRTQYVIFETGSLGTGMRW